MVGQLRGGGGGANPEPLKKTFLYDLQNLKKHKKNYFKKCSAGNIDQLKRL